MLLLLFFDMSLEDFNNIPGPAWVGITAFLMFVFDRTVHPIFKTILEYRKLKVKDLTSELREANIKLADLEALYEKKSADQKAYYRQVIDELTAEKLAISQKLSNIEGYLKGLKVQLKKIGIDYE